MTSALIWQVSSGSSESGNATSLMLHKPSCDPRGPCHNSPPACVEVESLSCQTWGGSLHAELMR
ncbi:hypothetical protein Tco_0986435, partial [Tanacetum coccineum]